jgi:pimeloyl-ACP methyl ester carboxylesterase
MFTEHTFDAGAVAINYAEGPAAGAPLVLLHGGSARWQSLNPILPDLAARWHVFAPDLRGHGGSSWTPGHYRLQDYADDIARFLEQRVPTPAAVFGHSLGGMVAILLAAQHPNLARAALIGDAPLSRASFCATIAGSRERLRGWRELMRAAGSETELIAALKDVPIEWPGHAGLVPTRLALGEDSPWFEWMAANLRHNDPAMLTSLIDDLEHTSAGYEMETLLPRIQCPVLIIQADPAGGSTLSDAEVERARALLGQSTLARLHGVGHALFVGDRTQTLRAIVSFLERVEQRELMRMQCS